MLSLGQSNSCLLRWDEMWGTLWQERRWALLLRLKQHKDCSLTATVTGGRVGTRGSNSPVTCRPSCCRAGCHRNHSFPERGEKSPSNCAGIGTAGNSCSHQGPAAHMEPRATSSGLRLLASHLVQFWRLWSYSLQDEIVPLSGE